MNFYVCDTFREQFAIILEEKWASTGQIAVQLIFGHWKMKFYEFFALTIKYDKLLNYLCANLCAKDLIININIKKQLLMYK